MLFLNKWEIIINKIPNYDYILNYSFEEPINVNLLMKIYNLPDNELSITHKKIIKFLLLKNINFEEGILNVKYSQIIKNLGRFYPDNNRSLLFVPRKIKHTLFKYENWIDIDIKKSYPSIIVEVGKLNGYKFQAISEYINNFEKVCDDFREYYSPEIENDYIKNLFNNSIFGGKFNYWILCLKNGKVFKYNVSTDRTFKDKTNEYVSSQNTFTNLDLEEEYIKIPEFKKIILKRENIHPFYKKYMEEFNIFFNNMLENNEELINLCIDFLINKNKKVNLTSSKIKHYVLHNYFGIIESYILTIAYDFLIEKGIILEGKCLLEFDGICIPNCKDKFDIDSLLMELNSIIYNKTRLNIIFTYKPYKNYYNINIIN